MRAAWARARWRRRSRYRRAAVASAACLALASCSETAAPPPLTATTSTSVSKTSTRAAAPPAPITGPLEKDWKSYGGTAYFGCPEKFSAGKSALEDIRPKIFDPKTGQYVAPAIPTVPAGESLIGGMCALTGTADDMKVVYLVATTGPAQPPAPAATKTTAYVYDSKSGQQVATKELQPPSLDLKPTAPKDWGLGSTASGVAWLNAFTDGHGAASPPRTVVLSGGDLSTIWTDPQPGRVWQDVLAFQRNTEPGKTSGAELRRPSGEAIFQDNDVQSVDAELTDGPNKLVKLTHWDSYNPPALSTMFYDLNAKSIIKIGDSDRISGGGLSAALSDGKLFVDGHGSDTSQFGFGVWNLRTQQWDFQKSRDDAKKLSVSKLAFFEDHLYITGTGGTNSVIALPATDPVAPNWALRPFERISGWTLVCRGETAPGANGECKEIVMVQDQDGHYPGPWF
ncbi:hypothetical protein A5659_14715 [Mycobacterium sp. 1165196.3]|uniref:hypothetical protein n=1 Tax=unclassified Mycobacterium TaxID=2642494 RepID=UPI0007FB898C|nr:MULTISPECIES: hypothetical protein [unclassified Mycobacterium]OBJ07739.1 hypothetical protein A5624_21525 [Mycobacterium sp. 1482292.6]OBJ23451.1 hypothetical protein A5622_13200 [Mycobacterium sp. 1245801.1]OBK38415.1 hypothetical protein A5659_14715 [Mycobacterium sp. 1165196.3]OBL08278.1 hypothetical protein A5646_12680 [Mycobacterium sp. 1245499.0]